MLFVKSMSFGFKKEVLRAKKRPASRVKFSALGSTMRICGFVCFFNSHFSKLQNRGLNGFSDSYDRLSL